MEKSCSVKASTLYRLLNKRHFLSLHMQLRYLMGSADIFFGEMAPGGGFQHVPVISQQQADILAEHFLSAQLLFLWLC